MKKCLSCIIKITLLLNFYFLALYSAYAQKTQEAAPVESRIQNLEQEIRKEETALESLRDRHANILKEKQGIRTLIKQQAAKQRLLDKENNRIALKKRERLLQDEQPAKEKGLLDKKQQQEKAREALINKELRAWEKK